MFSMSILSNLLSCRLMQKNIVAIGMMLLLIISASSCRNNECDTDDCIVYGKEILDNAVALSNKVIELPDDYIFAERFWLISDTMLVVGNRKEAGNYLDIVNPISGKKYSSLLAYGEGPEEMIMCGIYYDGHYLTAVDYVRSRYARFTPCEASQPGFKPRYIDYPREIGVTTPPIGIGDTTYIVNPYHYINRSNDIVQDVDRFFVIDNNRPDSIVIEPGLLYTHNVDQSVPLVDEVNRRIWLFRKERSIIDIYDYQINNIKSIKIIDELDRDPDVVIDENTVIYRAKSPRAYLRAIIDYDNSEILAAFSGKLSKPVMSEKVPSKILVFDLDGNFKRAYQCQSYLYSLTKTAEGLFATVYDDEDMPVFVKLE